MKNLLQKYEKKLINHGLCLPGEPLLGGLDADLVWNRNAADIQELKKLFDRLTINSLLFAKPAEPYFSILNFLAEESMNAGEFIPDDTETRTFLHSIPVTKVLSAENAALSLKRRKCLVVKDRGIIGWGTVSPEQAFITFSSVCFAGFVKFFTDFYTAKKEGGLRKNMEELFRFAINEYLKSRKELPAVEILNKGPFTSGAEIMSAMDEAGKKLVDCRMVDSFFGNISYRQGNGIYISQTGSSLDELTGCIDNVPLDGSSCTGLTASSEYTSHREVLIENDYSCILHGHPKFAVILSMLCDKKDCGNRGLCYKNCKEKRFAAGLPIIPGEVGTGPTGLVHTLPPALKEYEGTIVYGHGLFTKGSGDFRKAFSLMLETEQQCMEEYLKKLEKK
ncbi:MAG: class II aldolase/adducin family protein [Bacteroidota bacterium]